MPDVTEHAFVPDPWGRDVCDATVADPDGRTRTCCRRRREHGQAAAAEHPGGVDEQRAGA